VTHLAVISRRWRTELRMRRREAASRAQTHLANRTFKRRPSVLDGVANALLRRAIGPTPPVDPELDHDA
jgi:hypothetical protein